LNIKNEIIKPIAAINEELATLAGKARISLKRTENVINKKKYFIQKKKPKLCIVYLVSPSKSVHSTGFMGFQKNLRKIELLKQSLFTVKKYLPDYPIMFFHEDYTANDMKNIKQIVNKQKLNFIKVNFDSYKGKRNLDEWMKKQKGFVEGRPAGYRMMCRFFSGVLQNTKELSKFDYYIRMDHDSFFVEPKKLDVEECIKKYDFDYLYRSVWTDHKEKESIWKFTKNYAKKNGLSLEGFKKLKMLNVFGNFNGRSPYNNFHISKVSFWKNPEVKKFLDTIEKEDGIILKHWQDTTVHSMILGLFNATVLEKTDFGYMHNFHYSILGSKKIHYLEDGGPLGKIIHPKK
jgi:hypothetical protein